MLRSAILVSTEPETVGAAPVSQSKVQSGEELDEFYEVEDPWNYDTTPDDAHRVARLLAAIPRREYRRTLDIGCGNGFVTAQLPGTEIVGVDISERAIAWARRRADTDRREMLFQQASIFDLESATIGYFDLIVVTGVFYPQYIGHAYALVSEVLRDLLQPGWVLATVHIDAWTSYRPPFTILDVSVDPYRQYFHRLEVFQR